MKEVSEFKLKNFFTYFNKSLHLLSQEETNLNLKMPKRKNGKNPFKINSFLK